MMKFLLFWIKMFTFFPKWDICNNLNLMFLLIKYFPLQESFPLLRAKTWYLQRKSEIIFLLVFFLFFFFFKCNSFILGYCGNGQTITCKVFWYTFYQLISSQMSYLRGFSRFLAVLSTRINMMQYGYKMFQRTESGH